MLPFDYVTKYLHKNFGSIFDQHSLYIHLCHVTVMLIIKQHQHWQYLHKHTHTAYLQLLIMTQRNWFTLTIVHYKVTAITLLQNLPLGISSLALMNQ